MPWLFNERHSIKTQLGVAFLLISTIAFGICIAISLGFTSALGTGAYSTAEDGIAKQTKSNAATASNELAITIAEELEVVAESICMVAALQSSIFIQNIRNEGGSYVLPLKSFESFKEYNFVSGCEYPSCPKDFGDLSHRSRFSNWNGSIEHSSVYMYNSKAGNGIPAGAIRNDSSWNNLLAQREFVEPIIDSMAYQDAPFEHLYNRGYNATVSFYLTVQLGDENTADGYVSLHRVFPGTERNSTTYDPPNRTWFRHAPVDTFYMDGPYRETFTQKYIVNLSTRRSITVPVGGLALPLPSVVVSAAAVLLESLAEIIQTKDYPNYGFGVLIKRDTSEVLVWHNSSQEVYDNIAGRFRTLGEMEPLLAGVDVSEKRTFTYSDSAGVHWLVATSPCLVNTDFETSQTTPALVMLVFSQWDSATAYLPVLRRNIDSTTDQIYFSTGIITAAVFVLMLCYVAIFVSWFTAPLTKMRQILSQVIEIAAEDENKRDYSAVVSVAWFDPKRSDELGYLATSFWYMIMQLHNSNEAKKSRPKHPANPFHLPTEVFLFGDSAPLENAASTQAVVGGRSAVLDKSSATGGPIRSTAASAVGPLHPPTSATTSDLMTLFLSPTTEQLVTPEVFLEQLNRHIASSAVNGQQSALDGQGQQGAVVESQPAAAIVGTEGDILAQLSAQFAMPDEGGAQSLSAMEMGKISPATPTRPEDSAAMATTTGVTAYAAVSTAEQVSAQPARVRSCQVFTLKVYLYGLSFLLLASLIAIMGAAVYLLQSEGESWMYETGDSVEAAEMLNLLTITETKSDFVMTYFKQATIDTQVLASGFTSLMDGNLTDADTDPLISYSLDPTNFYSFPLAAPTSIDFTGYFDVDSTNCITSAQCAQYQNSDITRLTSLVDFQFRPYFHARNILDFLQTGHEDVGYTRIIPYSHRRYSDPASCFVEDRSLPYCDALYQNSRCNPAVTTGSFPPYDARCRNWYRRTLQMGVSTAEVSFEYPRVSSGGSFVVTAVSPIRRGQSDTGLLYGVLNMNVLATTLSASINEFQILQTGYVYLVDAKNVSRIVIHPSATATCTSVRCCEAEFSSEEFEIFFADVLLPLQRQSPEEGAKSMNISTFRKGGEAWRFAHSMVTYGTVDYILFAVVPRSEIIKSSTDVEEQVSDSNTGILAAACCVLLVFTCVIFYIIGLLVEGIAQPVIELSRLCDQVIEGTLTGNAIPTKASSSDVRMLLTAFTNTMTALRFGSDSYAKGDVNLARELFEEALLLYTSTHQEKGIGACHNNLGAVYSSLGQYSEALVHYSKAIQQAEKALSEVSPEEEAAAAQQGGAVATAAPAVAIPTAALSPPSARATATSSPQHQYTQVATVATSSVATAPASTVTTNAASTQGVATAADKLKARRRAQRVLSDRRGNLALLHIAQEQYAEAFTCLESCMEQDKKWGYIRGCVVKQGNMGHLYLKQGELQSAERIFRSALTFVTAQDSRFFSESWGETETLLARQIALFNMGKLHEHLKQPALAVHYYLLALSHAPVLHLGTATQTLTCLSLLLSDKPEGKKASSRPAPGPKMAEAALVERLEEIAKENNLTQKALDGSTSASNSMPKRVAFALDYSGSMSGGKIRAAIGSLNDLFVNQLASQDELMILKFSHSCTVELPLTKKQHNEERISNLIRSLHQPGGGTALYDAIKASVSALPSAGGYASGNANNDWVVVLTDGQEGASEIRKSTVENVLRSAACGFVMMGVGSDVNADELEGLVRCAKKGFYVPASGDQEGIRKAFGRVATLIQGQVIMEDL